MLAPLFKPHHNMASLILRIGLAAVFLYHGYLKLVQGKGMMWNDDLTETTQLLVTWGEIIGGAALLLGILTRFAALGLVVIQIGAIITLTGKLDFIHAVFTQHGYNFTHVGYEYNFVLIVALLALMTLGGGLFSVDHCLWGRRKAAVTPPGTV